jgi:hypothetical protein
MIPTPVTSVYTMLGHWDLEKMIARNVRKDGASTMTVDGGILKCKSTSIVERAYTFHRVYVPTGGWVEVEFMAKVVSGEGDVYMGGYETPSFSAAFEQDTLKLTDKNWKYYRMQFPSRANKNYIRTLWGLAEGTVGEVWFRSISVKTFNTNPHPDFRFAAIKGSKTTWNLDDGVGAYSNEGIISVTLQDAWLEVRMVPFNTWSKPVFSANVLRDGNTGNWMASVGTVTDVDDYSFRVYFVKPSTGAIMNPRDATEDLTVIVEAKAI